MWLRGFQSETENTGRAGLMSATAVAMGRLMSCIASVVVVVLRPDEKCATVVFSGTAAKHCSSVQDSNEVGGACGER